MLQAYAALACYDEHKAEIDEQIRAQVRRAEAFKKQRLGRWIARDALIGRLLNRPVVQMIEWEMQGEVNSCEARSTGQLQGEI